MHVSKDDPPAPMSGSRIYPLSILTRGDAAPETCSKLRFRIEACCSACCRPATVQSLPPARFVTSIS